MENLNQEVEDQQVLPVSTCLKNKTIHLVISGSIAAVETIKLIRSLRRLGARVVPILTEGGAMFVTQTSLEWASQNKVITKFSGLSDHATPQDYLVVAPCSGSFLAKMSAGISSCPASAFVSSYLGHKTGIMIVPTMHENMWLSPVLQKNIHSLKNTNENLRILFDNPEESRRKFPNPDWIANEVSHEILKKPQRVFVNMGATKSPIDPVRSIVNESSGNTGTVIVEELYRNGLSVDVLCGLATKKPNCGRLIYKPTLQGFTTEFKNTDFSKYEASIYCAAILDYAIADTLEKKLSSKDEELQIKLTRTEKLISLSNTPIKIGFKLSDLADRSRIEALARQYIDQYQLSLLVFNQIHAVKSHSYQASLFGNEKYHSHAESRIELAEKILKHILERSPSC